MIEIEAARIQLLDITHDLDAIKFRLLGVQSFLPLGVTELDRLSEVDATDPATRLRTVIACVLMDSLGPAIRDLEAAASPSSLLPGDRPGEGGA